jgi:hypothetical protein
MILRLAVWWQTRPLWARATLAFGGLYAAAVAAGAVVYLTS